MMFSRKHRCIECGFLATRRPADRRPREVSLPEREDDAIRRLPFTIEIVCYRRRYDLPTENLTTQIRDTSLNRDEARLVTLKDIRPCEWFEDHGPGLSFEGHLDRQERRREWVRTAIVALVAAVIGGVIATIPTVLSGHDVSVFVGR